MQIEQPKDYSISQYINKAIPIPRLQREFSSKMVREKIIIRFKLMMNLYSFCT